METQNITLALPKEVLRKAKGLAVERNTSLSAMLAQMIRDEVEHDAAYRAARDRALAAMRTGFDLGTNGIASWTRDELHER